MLGKAHVRGIREGYRSVYVAFLIGSCTDFHTVCWAADNSSTVSMCMFLLVFYDTEGLPPVSGGSCAGVFWALVPSLVCFAVVSCAKRKSGRGSRCWWLSCSVFFHDLPLALWNQGVS